MLPIAHIAKENPSALFGSAGAEKTLGWIDSHDISHFDGGSQAC
jgi:hypothetical protein